MPYPPRMLTHAGQTLSLDAWAVQKGLAVETIRCRLDRLQWPVGRALDTPADRRFRRGGRPRTDVPRAVPNLRHDKPTGRAFSRWMAFGRDNVLYFGPWGTAEATANYRRFASEWAAGRYEAKAKTEADGLYVADLIVRWLARCQTEYQKGGKQTSEYGLQKRAIVWVNELYGDTRASEFTPAALRAVRAVWVKFGWVRTTINGHTGRVVRMFGWAVGQSMIPAAVVASLREVEHLKAGREAPDRPRIKPATDADVAAVLPHLAPTEARRAKLAAMIRVQRLSGMRPGELCAMRPTDLNRSADVWIYEVSDLANKNLHRGKPQRYYLGPLAQAALAPYLHDRAAETIFDTSRGSYGLAIRLACRAAGIPTWHPHQLRHALATEVAHRFSSLSAAAAAIGDTNETANSVYVHLDPAEKHRIEIAKTMG